MLALIVLDILVHSDQHRARAVIGTRPLKNPETLVSSTSGPMHNGDTHDTAPLRTQAIRELSGVVVLILAPSR